jgi:hypothetical protein
VTVPPTLKTIGWLAAALVIAFGAGGVAAVGDHPPGDATRPELTARADAEVATALAPILLDLGELEREVTGLGGDARRALGRLNARDAAGLRQAVRDGDERLAVIARLGGRIGLAFDDLPYTAGSSEIGQRSRARLSAVEAALRALIPVGGAWDSLAARAGPAAELVVLIERHDTRTFSATQRGADGEYARAIALLKQSLSDLDRAGTIRDALKGTTDVGTLDEWIRRNRAYDEALVTLYQALEDSGGTVTAAVRAAFAEVERRQDLLPQDTRTLVIIMGDVALGGLNQAAIAIEEARGRLSQATQRLH